MRQATIAHPVECTGTGLHSGRPVRMKLIPAPEKSGIRFAPFDASSTSSAPSDPAARLTEIPAEIGRVHSSARATVLAPADGSSFHVSTVEHLLASLYAHEIDNLRIEVEGAEIPVFDGSAAPLFELITSAGRKEQLADRIVIELDAPLEIREGKRWIRAEPSETLSISYAIDFEHASIGRQALDLPSLDAERFVAEVARARTFGFEEEVAALQSSGFGLGGSLGNTIVLGPSGVLNEGGLRYADEFVRHKVIDLIGDLSLLGARLNAHVQVERGGHALHHRLVRAIAASKTNWISAAAGS